MATAIKVQVKVDEIQRHDETVYSVLLRLNGRSLPRIKPGQFLHLALDDYDPAGGFWPDSRVFSLASIGEETLQIVYSVKGVYTKRMERELIAGRTVWIKLPYGNFVIDSAASQSGGVVLVAGGTGIAPFIPFLENCLKKSCDSGSLRLYYGIRRPTQALFQDLIRRCESALSGFSYVQYIEESNDIGTNGRGSRSGRLDIGAIYEESPRGAVYYLSGPPSMVEIFQESLITRGVDKSAIKIDEWE
jgi:NAD(P)H-flavin reductase